MITRRNQKAPNYKCECGKTYTHRQGLYHHRKTCSYINDTEQPQHTSTTDPLVLTLVEQLGEITKILAKNQGGRSTNNRTTNKQTINNNFQINVEVAKSYSDFRDETLVSNDHLEFFKHSDKLTTSLKVFQDNFLKLEKKERPMYCTSLKDPIMYKSNGQFIEDKNNYVAKEWDNEFSNTLVGKAKFNCKKNDESSKDAFVCVLKAYDQVKPNYYDDLTKNMKQIIVE